MERTRDTVSTPVETEEDYLKQTLTVEPTTLLPVVGEMQTTTDELPSTVETEEDYLKEALNVEPSTSLPCLLYTSPSPRDLSTSRMPSSA